MNRSIIHLTIWSVILILAQALVFNHVCLFGYAVPFVFLYTLVKLPLNMSREWLFTIGFCVGLIIDIFSDTLGMNALASTLIMALRQPILRLYVPRDNELADQFPGIRSLGMFTFIKFTLTFTFVYTTLIFFIDAFSVIGFLNVIVRIITSTILTTLLLVGIECLTSRKSEKRL